MAVQIQLRNDTAANWTSANPTLAAGEMGVETDTLKFKFGNGSTAWTSLGYGLLTGTLNQSALTTTVSDKSANYTIVAGDKNSIIRSTSTAITITIANVLAIGERIDFIQSGTGQITFAAGSGVTLQSADSLLKTAKQHAGATVQCVASGIYVLVGNLG